MPQVNGVTVFGGFLLETIATFLFVLAYHDCNFPASKGNGAIAGLVIGLSLTAFDSSWLEHLTFSKPSS